MPKAKTIPAPDGSPEKGASAKRTPKGINPCLIEGCTNTTKHGGRGLCLAHYRRLQKYGNATEPIRRINTWNGITCTEPGCRRNAKVHGLCSKHYLRPARHRLGRALEVFEAQQIRSRASRDRKLKAQETEMGRSRPLICEVCMEPGYKRGRGGRGPSIVFDHCHSTGAPRGWLCDRCNKTLGLVKDRKELLVDLAVYLETSFVARPYAVIPAGTFAGLVM